MSPGITLVIIRRLGAALACLLAGVACATTPCERDDGQAPLRQTSLVLESRATGRHTINAEVADNARERGRGLMCRHILQQDFGMLFVYPEETEARMWMKDTLLSLDLLFARADGRIVKLIEHAKPLSEAWLEAGQPVRYVLELPAGTAARLDVGAGDAMVLPRSLR